MIQLIYFDRRISGRRYFLSASKDVINNTSFIHPLNPFPKQAELKYLTETLYLLDYLKVSYPSFERLTFEYVINSIPEELLDKVYGVEFINVFYSSEFTNILNDSLEHKHVAFVALLTKENTGRALPNKNMPETKPIGLSAEEWAKFSSIFPV